MRGTAVARRYAKAFIEIGVDEGSVERFGKELRDLLAVVKGHPELLKVLLSPMLKLEERKGLIDGVVEMLGASDTFRRLVALLVENRKIGLLEEICKAYARLEDERMGRLRVEVRSSAAAGEDFLSPLKAKLSAGTGKTVILSHTIDESLIGGFVLNLGNTIFDGSVKGQLELIREKMLGGAV